MEKTFLITVDTEGDNQWNIYHGENIHTENAKYIPTFQKICDEFRFKPVYLVNYEMICNDYLVDFFREQLMMGKCEVGMHLHAWNSPPLYLLNEKYNGNPYITEYPKDIIFQKMEYLTKLIESRVGVRPVSHRAGRWATNNIIFNVLAELGYEVDCSIVAGCDMSKYPGRSTNVGFNYKNVADKPYMINASILEVPMVVKKYRTIAGKNIKSKMKNILFGKDLWFRPALSTVKEMKKHVDEKTHQESNYLEFMIHSSELMPGGSPYFKTKREIEQEYKDIRAIFEYVYKKGFIGKTLKEYKEIALTSSSN